MTPNDYLDVGVRMLMVGLVVYPGVRFLVKPAIRVWIRLDGVITAGELHAYRTLTRLSAPVLGLALGLHPDLMPEWMPVLWSVICGTVGGSFAIAAHHAVEATLPAAVARLLTGAGLRPAGRVVDDEPMPYSSTDNDTLTTEDVGPVETPPEWDGKR